VVIGPGVRSFFFDLPNTASAGALNISVDTLQHWERGDRQPRGPAKALLRAVANDPKAVLRALGAK
jgi:putative transcriptional regulator